jgi:probable rRNA maturation factor
MLKVDFLVEPHYKVDRRLIRTAATKTAEYADLKTDAELTVSIIGDRKMKSLNKDFRGKDQTTNVLSFNPTEVEKLPHFHQPETEALYVGDIAVSYPVAVEEAITENVLVDERIAFLVVHGLLHLFGYDHEEGNDALQMENLEDKIMRSLRQPVNS